MGFDWRKRVGKSEYQKMDAATYTAYRLIELFRNRPGRADVAEVENIYMALGLVNNEYEYPAYLYQQKFKDGHFLTGWKLSRGLCFEQIKEKEKYFGDAFGGECYVYRSGGSVVVEIMRGVRPTKVIYDFDIQPYLEKGAILPLFLGVDNTGENQGWDLVGIPHILNAGTTNTGKSNLFYVFADCLMQNDNVKLFVIDLAQTDFAYLEDKAVFAGDIFEAAKVIHYLETEVQRRLKFLRSKKCYKIQDYNTKFPGEKMPYLVLMADEFAFLSPVMASDKDDMKFRKMLHAKIAGLAMIARKVGVHLMLATQYPTIELIPSSIKGQFAGRTCFKVVNGVMSQVVLDSVVAAELPNTKGVAVAQLGNEFKVVQTPFLDHDLAIERLKKYPSRKDERFYAINKGKRLEA